MKKNIFYILQAEADDTRNTLVDDCGAFGNRGNETAMYLRDADDRKWQRIKRDENNVYCKGGKNVPLSPQPSQTDIIVMKRKVAYGKDGSGFKRIHSFVDEIRESDAALKSLVFVQYCGKMQNPRRHGNARSLKRDFKRAPTSVFQTIRQMSQEGKGVNEIFTDLHRGDNPDAPRDKKMVKNTRQRFFMDDPMGNWSRSSNAADEILEVMTECINHPFLKEIKQFDNCPPAFFCCGPNAIRDIQMYCTVRAKYPGTCHVDRTFGLSRMFVTMMSYSHPMLRRTGTNINPTLWGPLFCHWAATFSQYFEFFSSIQKHLVDAKLRSLTLDPESLMQELEGNPNPLLAQEDIFQTAPLVLGSDQELAMIKASTSVFGTHHMLCTGHLDQSIKRRLNNSAIAPAKRYVIAQRTMDLRKASSLDAFDHESKILGAKIKSKFPEMGRYYDNFVAVLRRYVVIPKLKGETDGNFTTNRSEALNSVLRLRTNWTSQKLLDLIKILQDLEEAQRIQIRRSLYAPAEFELAGPMAKLKVSEATWEQWGEDEPENRDVLEAKFHAGPRVKRKTRIESTKNPIFAIPSNFPNVAKKPGPRRPRSHRTRSYRKPCEIHSVPNLLPTLKKDMKAKTSFKEKKQKLDLHSWLPKKAKNPPKKEKLD